MVVIRWTASIERSVAMLVRIYGAAEDSDVEELVGALRKGWEALRLPSDSLELQYWAPGLAAKHGRPDIHVHFRSTGADAELRRAVDEGSTIIAVLPDAPSAKSSLPPPLAKLNAFLRDRYGSYWCEALVDEILTRAILPRRTPQAFISYRRDDSEHVAAQLHAELTRLGFLTFLDTVSIGVAEDFQHELMWRLNDTDLVILLASPRLGGSSWVRQEVEFARTAGVGMLVVVWPDECFELDAKDKPKRPFIGQLIDPHSSPLLTREDLGIDPRLAAVDVHAMFTGAHKAPHSLSSTALDQLVAAALELRARALHERRLDLLSLVYRREKKRGNSPQHAALPGDLRVDRDGHPHLIRVFPFRPEPTMLHGTATMPKEGESSSAVYRENYPHDDRVSAMKWLAERDGFTLSPFTTRLPRPGGTK